MDEAEIKAEIARLEAMLAKRKGRYGFADNVKIIEGLLGVLRGQLS